MAWLIATALPMGALAAEQAGVAAAVVSPVEIDGVPRAGIDDVQTGAQIFTQDRITTGSGGRAQILFLDETALTIGPNSEVVIDRFVYDPNQGTGEIAAEMATGFLRYLSGSVGSNAPENVSIGTPAATIGIRGSAVIVAQTTDDPDTWFCGVLGPGLVNNALARRGACIVSNEEGETEVRASGFGSFVTKGQPPGDPIPLTEDVLARVHELLRPTERIVRRPVDGVGDPVQSSGQGAAESTQTGVEQAGLLGDRFDQLSVNLDSNVINPIIDVPDPDNPDPVMDLPLTVELTAETEGDFGLNITGEDPFSAERYNVFRDEPEGPLNFDGTRIATLELGPAGSATREVAIVEFLGFEDLTRISVFNIGDDTPGGTGLSDSDVLVSLLANGVLERGPGGTVVISGDVIDQISPPSGNGNTFVAYEIAPNGDVTRINELTDFETQADVE
ncbi:MAG: FecR family protein [Pseudomonadota bacterium]